MKIPQCAKCPSKFCNQGIKDKEIVPDFCPMVHFADLIGPTAEEYLKPEVHDFFLQAAITEREAYDEKFARGEGKIRPVRPRIREIAEFAKKIKVGRLGMAFCIGLADEAARAAKILESHGLEICSVVCSCGAIDKTAMKIPAEDKIRDPENFEASCNPILQAEILSRSETGFNVIIGLCVGHDMLFTQHCQAPVTTLIVKDRMLAHNPVISLYSRYHKDLV